MNKRFTKLIAALALLVFMTPSLAGWGQTRATGDEISSISNIESGKTYYIKGVRSNSTYYLTFTDATGSQSGTEANAIGQAVAITFTSVGENSYNLTTPNGYYIAPGTSNGKINVSNNPITVNASDVNNLIRLSITSGTTEWSIQKNTSAANFGGYKNTQKDITLIEAASSSSPTLSVNSTSIDFGSRAINPTEPYEESFEVSFANLTQDLTVTPCTGVTVSPTTIATNATSPQTVTVIYNPTTVGSISGDIVVSNTDDEVSATVAVTGSAYDPSNVDTYALYTGPIVEGDYVIYAANGAMKNEIVSNRFANQSVSVSEEVITNPANTVVWHIAANGSYWTIYNAAIQKYAGGTSSKNQGALLDEITTHAQWTITYNNGYTFENYGRSQDSSDPNNKYLRQNTSSGWATYANGTGSAPTLYKKVNTNQVATPTYSVEAGTYLSAQSVSISCETEGATIQYKTTENGEWQNYSTPINVNETMTILAKATKTGMDESEIAIVNYTIVIIEHEGTEEDPYSVADARNLIDQGEPYPQNVYATGIVSEIVTAYNSQYGNISYNISADGETSSDQLEVFRGKSYNGENFTSEDDIQVGDIVVVYGNLKNYNGTYEFDAGNQLVSLERPQSTDPVINANNPEILAYDATSGSIAYTITNPVEGVTLQATTTAEWISNVTVGESVVTFTTTANEGTADRNATITLSYTGATDKVVTVTQGHFVADFATLPFNWAGGTSAALEDLAGVTVNCDPSDYAASNAPYRVKFNEDGHYILIKTNEQPAVVSVGIKKYAAGNTASLTIEGSSDGVTFTEVQSFSITGAQNAVFTYITTNAFATTDRYVRIYYNKPNGGSNVGVGPIIIRGIESYPLTITGYASDDTKDGFYLIASPVSVNPATVEGMTEGDFDLYYYDDAEELEWRNYKTSAFNLTPGTGYLYAKKATTETPNYQFTLTGAPYAGQPIQLIQGWNLVGNPYGQTAYITNEYYVMNGEGSELVAGEGNAIDAMQGIFVNATEAGTMTFSTENNSKAVEQVVMNVTRNRSTAIDRAIVRFDEGQQLPKFQLNPNNTKLYIAQGNKDYAIVRSATQGEMPVSFRAAENGTYTLSIETENVEMDYLHLIDNMTGMDVDLLATPSYSFEARKNDYASRFRLVFSANGIDEQTAETFAYFNGTSWTVSNTGDATLQVVDITGRIVSSETINGNATVSLNQPAGIYMLRLVNGNDVKVQKVVVR